MNSHVIITGNINFLSNTPSGQEGSVRQYWTQCLSKPRNLFFAWLLEPTHHWLLIVSMSLGSESAALRILLLPTLAIMLTWRARWEEGAVSRPVRPAGRHPRASPAPAFPQDVLCGQR